MPPNLHSNKLSLPKGVPKRKARLITIHHMMEHPLAFSSLKISKESNGAACTGFISRWVPAYMYGDDGT